MFLRRIIAGIMAMAMIFGVIYITKTPEIQTVPTSGRVMVLPVIIIDPGHGGMDSGTSGADGTREKDINLSIANHLNTMLIAGGFTTQMLRTDDALLTAGEEEETIRGRKREDINQRLSMIESQENCIVISIHQNYFEQEKYSGFQVFYNNKLPDNKILAQQLQSIVATQLQPDNHRAIATVGDEIYLLKHCTKPAVMVECGFMSNPKELSLLKNPLYQSKLTFLFTMGITEYVNDHTTIV